MPPCQFTYAGIMDLCQASGAYVSYWKELVPYNLMQIIWEMTTNHCAQVADRICNSYKKLCCDKLSPQCGNDVTVFQLVQILSSIGCLQ